MNKSKNKLLKYQEKIFDFTIRLSYILLLLSALGITGIAPRYLKIIDYYLRVYICLFLVWRFNPLRTYYEFTNLDRKIAFSAGLFILTTTILNEYIKIIKPDVDDENNKNDK